MRPAPWPHPAQYPWPSALRGLVLSRARASACLSTSCRRDQSRAVDADPVVRAAWRLGLSWVEPPGPALMHQRAPWPKRSPVRAQMRPSAWPRGFVRAGALQKVRALWQAMTTTSAFEMTRESVSAMVSASAAVQQLPSFPPAPAFALAIAFALALAIDSASPASAPAMTKDFASDFAPPSAAPVMAQ